MTWMTRSQWAGSAQSPAQGLMSGTPRGVAIHFIGPGQFLARGNSNPAQLMRDIRSWHTPQGKADFAYSLAVNGNGLVIEGRNTPQRPRVRPGSNGSSATNNSHYSVVLLTADRDPAPSEAMIQGAGRAVAWLRRHGGAGTQVVGHRDLHPTSCPGNTIQGMLGRIRAAADGNPAPPGAPPDPTPPPAGGWLIPGVIMAGAVTHVFFQNLSGGDVFVANRLAGTWSHVPNEATLRDMQYQITRQGLRWTNAGRVGNPAAFGVRVS
jgi:hypothetical protein